MCHKVCYSGRWYCSRLSQQCTSKAFVEMWLSDLVCWYQKNPESWSHHDLWKLCSFYTQEDPTWIHCQTSCSRMLEQSGPMSPHFKDWCWSARTGSGGFYLKTSCWHCSDTSKNNENTMHQRIVKYLKGFCNICHNFRLDKHSFFFPSCASSRRRILTFQKCWQ